MLLVGLDGWGVNIFVDGLWVWWVLGWRLKGVGRGEGV